MNPNEWNLISESVMRPVPLSLLHFLWQASVVALVLGIGVEFRGHDYVGIVLGYTPHRQMILPVVPVHVHHQNAELMHRPGGRATVKASEF